MSKTDSLTHKWLRQNVQPYASPDAVFNHVDAVLSRHPTIRPKTDVYTYDDGRTQLLLCLHGLLPVTFRGASYNIPIAVWLPRDYPRNPPLAYVVPTTDMLVRAGPDMDVSGRCLVQYLRDWERKSEGCNLAALLDAMQDAFSRQPPVYAKPKSTVATPAQSARPSASSTPVADYSHRPPPPIPVDRTASVRVPSPAMPLDTLPGGPPPLPAKPGTPAVANTPLSSRSTSVPLPHAATAIRSQSPANLSSPVLAMRPPPPLPPQEFVQNSPVPPSYASHGRSYVDLPANSTPPWPAHVPSTQTRSQPHVPYRVAGQLPSQAPPPPLQPALAGTLTGVASPTSYGGISQHVYSGQVQSPPPPLSFATPQHTGGASPPYVASPANQAPPPPFPATFSSPAPPPPRPPPSVPAPDLLDAEDDSAAGPSTSPPPAVAPPRPPNPELLRLHDQVHGKIASELASLSQAMALDAERLRANQTDLLAGQPAIRDEMARLEAVRDVCRGVAARLEGVVAAGERNVAELRRKGDPEVDEMICSTTIVYNQLINLVAEDNAIEDTIYHLHRALNTGRFDLERFLRVTRVLAEEQFMKRALIEKIHSGMATRRPPGDAGWSVSSDWR
ncbi:UEV-domain-containing protein [Polyporus arcularius HHB13444]|uniref:UEV-domain-containing protein n=1 Tax=Polyporus arcularius HHB13444 TaxID=1314778 RepID=A0A5C3PRZ6_9APHY|nr:UEV-domain-containing protein [Polyporus arcularius HHB13444]